MTMVNGFWYLLNSFKDALIVINDKSHLQIIWFQVSGQGPWCAYTIHVQVPSFKRLRSQN